MLRSIDWVLWGLLLVAAILEIVGDLSLKWWAEADRWLGFGGSTTYCTSLVWRFMAWPWSFLPCCCAGPNWRLLHLVGGVCGGFVDVGRLDPWVFGEALSLWRIMGIVLVIGGMALLATE